MLSNLNENSSLRLNKLKAKKYTNQIHLWTCKNIQIKYIDDNFIYKILIWAFWIHFSDEYLISGDRFPRRNHVQSVNIAKSLQKIDEQNFIVF